MSARPGLAGRVIALTDSFDRRRFRMGLDLLRRGEWRNLILLLRLHTDFRWRLRRLGVRDIEVHCTPPAEEPDGPMESYHEEAWPGDAPLVSVIIPCFNYGAFVEEAIDSVLAQTFQNLEVILVEGGSTDATTRQVVEALRRPRTVTLFRDTPCKAGDNRNFGICRARGKYICCLDADDILQPTYIEKSVFIMENYGYDVISTAVKQFGAVSGGYGLPPHPQLSDMVEGNHVTTCAVFRRVLWQRADGFKDTAPGMPTLHEDWRFWMRLAALGARILNITGEQLFWYRTHASASLSSQQGVLPNHQQAPLLRELNRDVITPEAFKTSRMRAATRLRSFEGSDNLIRPGRADNSAPTILLAVPHLALGGAERLLSEVVRGLRQSGYRIVIVTTIPNWAELGDTTSWFTPMTSEIYHLPRFLPRSRWFEFVEYLVRGKQVNTVLLAGSTWFYDAIPDLKSRHPHIHIVDILFNAISYTAQNRKIASLIDLTIVEGDDVRSWLLANGERPDRICTIRSGVDLRRFQPRSKPSRILDQLGLPRDAFIAGFSGRLAEEKAPLSFVTVAAHLRSLPIHFIMTGAGPLEVAVRQSIARKNLAAHFHFAGVVPEVSDYLACYDVLVLPSLIDGRPTVVMEALAMGIPVIASDVGSLPELVIDGKTGFLCKPGDTAALITNIRRLYEHPEERARMSEAARDFAAKYFRLDKMVDDYVDAIARVMSDGTNTVSRLASC